MYFFLHFFLNNTAQPTASSSSPSSLVPVVVGISVGAVIIVCVIITVIIVLVCIFRGEYWGHTNTHACTHVQVYVHTHRISHCVCMFIVCSPLYEHLNHCLATISPGNCCKFTSKNSGTVELKSVTTSVEKQNPAYTDVDPSEPTAECKGNAAGEVSDEVIDENTAWDLAGIQQ